MQITEEKKSLRKLLREKRRELALSEEKQICDRRIYKHLINSEAVNSAKCVLCYVSTDIEVDTSEFITYCFSKGIAVAVPRCTETEMTFYVIETFDDLSSGMYGIPEPKDYCLKADESIFSDSVCIVPGLAFDKDGYRLGYGKGYYDKFLSKFSGIAIGICYDSFIADTVPKDTFDRKVNTVITD